MRDITNKKGVIIGKILSTLPIFLLIVFFTGIFFILAAYAITVEKGKTNIPGLIENFNSDDFLFGEINIDGERIVLFDGLVRDAIYRNEWDELYSKIQAGVLTQEERKRYEELNVVYNAGFARNLRESIMHELEKDSLNYKGEHLCFIAFFNAGKPISERVKIGTRDIYFQLKDGNAETGDYADLQKYYNKGLLKTFQFTVGSNALNNKEKTGFIVQYYYGKCFGSENG